MKPILKRNNFFSLFAIFAFLIIISGCKNSVSSRLKNGDLLFVTAKESGLSGAINNVTQKQKNASFDHIGILQKDKTGIFVLHAAPKGGSQKQNLDEFLKDQANDEQKVVVYRLKSEFQKTIPDAIEKANAMLGKPYNFNYILEENSYYCSDYIERSFRKNHIFKLEPMTFVDPKIGKINAFWEEFYAKKNLKVPEGELGCNPNGLAASDKIQRIKEL
jgi:hypothetical protein